MEFSIELGLVTSVVMSADVGISITLLYKSKAAAIITPALLAILIGSYGLDHNADIRGWAFFALPSFLLGPIFVSIICYNKRLRSRS